MYSLKLITPPARGGMVKFLEVSILLFAQGMNARPGYAYISLCKPRQLPSPLRPQSSHLEHGQACGSSRELPPPPPPRPATILSTLAGAASPEGFTGSQCGRLRLHPMVAARPLPEGTKLIKPSRSHLLRGGDGIFNISQRLVQSNESFFSCE